MLMLMLMLVLMLELLLLMLMLVWMLRRLVSWIHGIPRPNQGHWLTFSILRFGVGFDALARNYLVG